MSKFIENAVNDVAIASETQDEIRRVLKELTVNVPRGMSEAHYFIRIGKAVIRYPAEAGQAILPETVISVYMKAVINGG